jgi:hypothetical protein
MNTMDMNTMDVKTLETRTVGAVVVVGLPGMRRHYV